MHAKKVNDSFAIGSVTIVAQFAACWRHAYLINKNGENNEQIKSIYKTKARALIPHSDHVSCKWITSLNKFNAR